MGMASSQARLLSLTSRQHSIELKAQVLQAQKLQLANDSDAAYDNYVKTLDATKLQTKLFNQDGKQAWVEASVNNLMRINSPETYGNTFLVKNIDDGKIYLPQSVAEKYESANGDEERFLQLNGITRTTVEDSTAKDAAKAKLEEAIAKGWGKLPKYEDFGITAEIYLRYKDLKDNFTDAKTVRNLLSKYYNNNASSNTLTNNDYTKMTDALKNLSSTEFASSDANLASILGGYHGISDAYGRSFNATGYYNGNMPSIEFENPNNNTGYLHQVDTWTKDAVVDFTSANSRTDALDSYSGANSDDGSYGKSSGVKTLSDSEKVLLYLAGGTYKVTYEQTQRHVVYYVSGNGDWDTANDLSNGRYDDVATESGVASELWDDVANENLKDNVTSVWYYGENSKYIEYLKGLNSNKPAVFQGHDLNWGYSDGFLKYQIAPRPATTETLVAETNIYSDNLLNAINTYLNGTTYEKSAAGALDKFTKEVLSYEQYADEVEQYDTAYENYVQYTVDLQEYKNTPVNKYVQYNNSVSGPYYENLFKAIQLSDGYHVISNAQAKDGDWVNSMARSGKVVLSIYETDKKEMNDYSAFSHPGLQEVANEGEMAVADVEYENALDAINSKELKISRRLSRLETERAAIKTEIDSIKQIRSDNINVAFKVFG